MSEPATAASGRFSILAVCTGNICRSPLAEGLLRQGLARWEVVDVASAGTGALVGEPMTPETLAIAHEYAVAGPEEHRARQLAVEYLRAADLVLALTRGHRAEIVGMLPRGSRRTFTLRELARLIAAVPASDFDAIAQLPLDDTAGRFAQLVDAAAALRGYVQPPERDDDDDVIDPYRRGDEVYREATAQLVPAVETILASFERAATVAADRV